MVMEMFKEPFSSGNVKSRRPLSGCKKTMQIEYTVTDICTHVMTTLEHPYACLRSCVPAMM